MQSIFSCGPRLAIEAEPSTAPLEPIDMDLGFGIFKENECLYALPQGWTLAGREPLQTPDLPAIRKRIWHWWHSLLD